MSDLLDMYLIFLFVYSSVGLMSDMWIGEKTVRHWRLPRRPVGASEVQEMACGHFQQKYDKVQAMIKTIGCMDELLSGALFNIYIQVIIYIKRKKKFSRYALIVRLGLAGYTVHII